MTTHTLNGREVMLVEVPEDMSEPELYSDLYEGWLILSMSHEAIRLPPANWEFILDTKEAGEEDYQKLYPTIQIDTIIFNTSAKKSVHQELGLDPSKRYVLISQNKNHDK